MIIGEQRSVRSYMREHYLENRRRIWNAGIHHEQSTRITAEERERRLNSQYDAEIERRRAQSEAIQAMHVASWKAAAEKARATLAHLKSPWRRIVEEVADKHGVEIGKVLGPCRRVKYVRPRQEVFYRLAAETPLSLPEMARRIGGRDHNTAWHAIRRHAERNNLPVPRQGESA